MEENQKENESKFVGIIEDVTAINCTTQSAEEQNKGYAEKIEKETSLKNEEATGIVEEISSTINLISENYDSLKDAKERGVSRTNWFKEQLDLTINKHKIENTEKFIGEIKDGLQNSNQKIGVEVFGKELNLSEPIKNPKYDGMNKTAIVKDFQNEIKNNTLLGAVVFENGKIKVDKDHKEIKAVKEYFEAKLDSPQDNSFKKGVTTASVIAQKKGILPKKLAKKSPEQLAMIVDKGVTSAKVAYKLGKGEITPIDAVEYTIDRNVSVLNSAIVTTTTRYGGAIGGKIGGAIGSIFGPVGTVAGAAIGTVVGKAGGYVVGKVIGEGVKKVATAVKSIAKSAWEGIKSVASNAWEGVKSFFGWW